MPAVHSAHVHLHITADEPAPVTVSAADPLNFRGILTPDERIAPTTGHQVRVA